MRITRFKSHRRQSRSDGSLWLSFSDLMSSLLLIIILVMFYMMYQYFEMYEINIAEIARRQYDLDAANAALEEQRTKLSEAEQQMLAQQIRLNAAEDELADAESILAAQQDELAQAKSLLDDKETEIAAQQERLDALSIQLGLQQTQIDNQRSELDNQRIQIASQQAALDSQQAVMDEQQLQLEELVGLKTRIITSLSSALQDANIEATVDPTNGSIALKSDVLFSTGKYELTSDGRASIDAFLPVYLNVLFSEEYKPYISEVIIEGHTDSVGEYLDNLELSQRRAGAVATYVLDQDYWRISPANKVALRKLITVNGRSSSDPVRTADGYEDQDASRRVVFKFRLTDEKMIEQMKAILESN